MSDTPFRNPGWAGNTGEFDLTEEQVRGEDFVGERPVETIHRDIGGQPALDQAVVQADLTQCRFTSQESQRPIHRHRREHLSENR